MVRKVSQTHPWDAVADELDSHSTTGAMRTFGDAYEPLVDEYGTDAAYEEHERFR